ncbi:hypothetical protein TIFTF001_027890 [Ficus carica]|uniref:Uncharacterized protein n=1 Tax=Ficus carica TaxID=3494 RepID=A0AA88IZ99_FICCA|nr:hypothetical protein TIFTF001_027890 [Ficus carica]
MTSISCRSGLFSLSLSRTLKKRSSKSKKAQALKGGKIISPPTSDHGRVHSGEIWFVLKPSVDKMLESLVVRRLGRQREVRERENSDRKRNKGSDQLLPRHIRASVSPRPCGLARPCLPSSDSQNLAISLDLMAKNHPFFELFVYPPKPQTLGGDLGEETQVRGTRNFLERGAWS